MLVAVTAPNEIANTLPHTATTCHASAATEFVDRVSSNEGCKHPQGNFAEHGHSTAIEYSVISLTHQNLLIMFVKQRMNTTSRHAPTHHVTPHTPPQLCFATDVLFAAQNQSHANITQMQQQAEPT